MSWVAAGAFLFSLGFFLYRYLGAFGSPADTSGGLAAGTWNVLLFSAFALHHSLFARAPVRRWVASVGPGVERSIYVLVASLMFVAVCELWQPLPGVAWDIEGAGRWLLGGLQFAGGALCLWSAASIDIGDLSGLSAPELDEPGGRQFRTDGPYGLVRHPIYVGWILLVSCAPLMTTTRILFAATSCLYIVIAIPLEERTLRAVTSGAYDRYARIVRWRLLPGVW